MNTEEIIKEMKKKQIDYILKNNSYNLSEEEKDILNKVHDQEKDWEQYKITANDIEKV